MLYYFDSKSLESFALKTDYFYQFLGVYSPREALFLHRIIKLSSVLLFYLPFFLSFQEWDTDTWPTEWPTEWMVYTICLPF